MSTSSGSLPNEPGSAGEANGAGEVMKGGARGAFLLVSLTALAGVALSGLLLRTHAQIASGVLPRSCTFLPGYNCAPVLTSPWSEIGGIPVAAFALAFYLLVAALAAQGFFRSSTKPHVASRNAWLLLLAALFSLGQTFRMAYISKVYIREFCPLCMGLYVVSVFFLLVAGFLVTRSRRSPLAILAEEVRGLISRPRLAATGGLLLVASPLFLSAVEDRYQEALIAEDPRYQKILDGKAQRFRQILVEDPGFTLYDRPDAKITIYEFLDYHCSYCRVFSHVLRGLAKKYPVRVKVLHYPIERACNPFATSSHPGSCYAALLGVVAGREGAYRAYHDFAFEDPTALRPANAETIARRVGVPVERLTGALSDTHAIENLFRQIEWARRGGVRATPTIFVNGVGFEGIPPIWFLKRWIEAEVERPVEILTPE